MSLTNLLYGRSSVPKAKRKILEKADKDIQYMQGAETAATKDIQRQTGVESDVDKAIRERAKRATAAMRALKK